MLFGGLILIDNDEEDLQLALCGLSLRILFGSSLSLTARRAFRKAACPILLSELILFGVATWRSMRLKTQCFAIFSPS